MLNIQSSPLSEFHKFRVQWVTWNLSPTHITINIRCFSHFWPSPTVSRIAMKWVLKLRASPSNLPGYVVVCVCFRFYLSVPYIVSVYNCVMSVVSFSQGHWQMKNVSQVREEPMQWKNKQRSIPKLANSYIKHQK